MSCECELEDLDEYSATSIENEEDLLCNNFEGESYSFTTPAKKWPVL